MTDERGDSGIMSTAGRGRSGSLWDTSFQKVDYLREWGSRFFREHALEVPWEPAICVCVSLCLWHPSKHGTLQVRVHFTVLEANGAKKVLLHASFLRSLLFRPSSIFITGNVPALFPPAL